MRFPYIMQIQEKYWIKTKLFSNIIFSFKLVLTLLEVMMKEPQYVEECRRRNVGQCEKKQYRQS